VTHKKPMEATGMPHYSPHLVIILIVVRLVFLVTAWCAKLLREQARVQGLALLLGAARPGVTVMRKSVDGSVLFVASAVERCQCVVRHPGRGERDGPS
jgi:hypothetical protein